MGSRLLFHCLRCFNSSSEAQQVEVVAYVPPSDSSPPSSRPSNFSLEQLLPSDSPPVSDISPSDVEFRLNHAQGIVMDIVRMESLPELTSNEVVKVHGKVTTAGFCMKTVWMVPQSIGEFLRFIRNFPLRSSWDSNIAESVKICELAGDVMVNYQRFKSVLTVSARDLLIAVRATQLNASTTVDVSVSIESPAYPPQSDIIRIYMRAGGYYLEKTADGTRVTAISEMNFGGMMPAAMVMRMSALAMGKFAKEMKAALSLHSQG